MIIIFYTQLLQEVMEMVLDTLDQFYIPACPIAPPSPYLSAPHVWAIDFCQIDVQPLQPRTQGREFYSLL